MTRSASTTRRRSGRPPPGRDGRPRRVAPEGLDTRLGKIFVGGTDLSIGQWQRLAIARALFRDAPGGAARRAVRLARPAAEADLFDLLQTLCDDRIVIFVSHRFATVRSADVVMVLDQGEVAEMGSHDELMSGEVSTTTCSRCRRTATA